MRTSGATRPIEILLVEGDADDRRAVNEALAEMSGAVWGVAYADDLESAIARIHAGGIDVVLLAPALVEHGGLAALDAITRDAPNLPVVVLTNVGNDALGVEMLRHGAQDYLVRGEADGRAIVRAIRYAIGRSECALEIRKLTLAVDQSPASVIITDTGGTIEYVNRRFVESTGYTAAEAVGSNPRILQSGFATPEQYRDLWKTILRGDVWRGQMQNRNKNGSLAWTAVAISPIHDVSGVVTHFLATQEDVTEHRMLAQALQDREALYRKLIDTSFDGIDRTEDGVICEANLGFARMFGYTMEDVIGRPISDFVADESMASVMERVNSEIEGSYELVGKRKDGTTIHLEATARTHQSGTHRGRLTALRDVTEKRALEAQFRQAQKMEAVGRLAGGVAHDFNNLLMVISGFGEMLRDDLGPHDPRRSHVDEVLKAAAAAAELTRQLLAFSRQQVIQPRLLKLEEIVSDSEKMLRRLIGEDVELVTVLNTSPATVRIDPSQLEQVIMNLVVNARDAMPDGGRITIETASIELGDAYAKGHWPATPGPYAMVAVTDTGIGMNAATQARVFEPFFTTKGTGKGTGLGLSMVYGIIQQSGGFIGVYSEPGLGTTFKIYLPRIDATAESVRRTDEMPAIPVGRETVLLVEDATAVRAAVQQILERQGYTVVAAPDGESALQLIASHPAPLDLLITDVVMPGMSGPDLATRFSVLRPDARVLFMSGYASDAIVRHGVLDSGIAYLQKPFSPEALARKVRRVLDNAREPVTDR